MAIALGNSGYEVQSIAADPEAQLRAQDATQSNTTADSATRDDFVLGACVFRATLLFLENDFRSGGGGWALATNAEIA